MKYFLLSAFLFAAVACNNKPGAIEAASHTTQTAANPIQDELSKLVNAIGNGDKHTIKQFIKFPFSNPEGSNEIWFQAEPGIEEYEKPFTEVDFDNYFTKLFVNEARPIFKEVDVKALFETNEFYKEVEFEKNHSKALHIEYNKAENIINIGIIDHTKFELTPDEQDENNVASSAIVYRFVIVNNALQLQGVYMAG